MVDEPVPMTAREFHKAWRRSLLLQTTSICVGVYLSHAPLVLWGYFDPPAVRERLDDLRRWVGDEGTYGAIGALLMIATWLPFFFIGLAPAYWIDRRFAVRCEHCRHKLAGKCRLDDVIRTGKCCGCDGFLFEPDAELADATAPKPLQPERVMRLFVGGAAIALPASFTLFGTVVGKLLLVPGFMSSWIGAGLGLYLSARYPSRELWLLTFAAVIAAALACIAMWNIR